jgi:hypothetical protein
VTGVDLNILVEDAVDALVRIATAAEREVGQEVASLQAELEMANEEIRRLREES